MIYVKLFVSLLWTIAMVVLFNRSMEMASNASTLSVVLSITLLFVMAVSTVLFTKFTWRNQ